MTTMIRHQRSSDECVLTQTAGRGACRAWAIGVALVATAGIAFPARAQEALTLDRALDLARQGNRDLKVARARLVESQSGVEQAWAALLPNATATGSYTRNYKNATFGDLFPISGALAMLFPKNLETITILDQNALQGNLSANVPIIAPAAYPALISAKSTYAAAQANFEVSETNVLYSTAQAYYAAAGADELLQARRHAIEVAQVTMRNAQSRLLAGTVNKTEVTRAQLALLNAEQNERVAEDTREQAYRSLATILGVHEPFQVTPPEVSAEEREEPSLESLTDEAYRLRPEFAAYGANIKAANDSVISNGLKWAPTLGAFGALNGYNYAGFTGDKYSWDVGLQVTWTLYDGGIRDALRHQAEAQRVENEEQLSELHDTIADDLANARRVLKTRRMGLRTAQESVALSNETLDLIRAQYDAGTATQLDVLTAQDSVVSAEVSLAQARFDLSLADLTLQRDAGTFPAPSNRP